MALPFFLFAGKGIMARLLCQPILFLMDTFPKGLTRVFFSNRGAEVNDASIKLARKATGRLEVISTLN